MTIVGKNYNNCIECGSALIHDGFRGEETCPVCGLVNREREIDLSIEPKPFFSEREKWWKKKTEIVSPFFGHQTQIYVDRVKNVNQRRVFKWHRYDGAQCNRTYSLAADIILHIGAKFPISFPHRIEALNLYKNAQKNGIVFGRGIEPIVLACIFIIIRKYALPITIDDLSHYYAEEIKTIMRFSHAIVKKLKISYAPPNIAVFFSRCCQELQIPHEIRKSWIKILENIPGYLSAGKNPVVFSSGLIYYLSKHTKKIQKINQREIAANLNVSTTSIRNIYRLLKNHRK